MKQGSRRVAASDTDTNSSLYLDLAACDCVLMCAAASFMHTARSYEASALHGKP